MNDVQVCVLIITVNPIDVNITLYDNLQIVDRYRDFVNDEKHSITSSTSKFCAVSVLEKVSDF